MDPLDFLHDEAVVELDFPVERGDDHFEQNVHRVLLTGVRAVTLEAGDVSLDGGRLVVRCVCHFQNLSGGVAREEGAVEFQSVFALCRLGIGAHLALLAGVAAALRRGQN